MNAGAVPSIEPVDPAAITFVTVTYRDELELLRLQARSMARYLSPDLVADILVIINDRDEAQVGALVAAIRSEYGPLAGRLRIVSATALYRWDVGPGGPMTLLRRFQSLHPWLTLRDSGTAWRRHGGWKMQQVCKLAAYRAVRSDRIVMLDSKYHFFREVRESDYFAADGRAYMICDPVADTRADIIATSFRWFGLSVADAGRTVTRGWMPFAIGTALLREAVEAIEARTGPLQVLFAVHRKRETEAMLINAYCCWRYGGLDQFFDPDVNVPPIIVRGATATDIERALDAVEAGGPLLALHRSVIGDLSQACQARLTGLWQRAGLIREPVEAKRIFALRDVGNATSWAAEGVQ